MVILDTSVVIDHLRQTRKGDTALMKLAKEMPRESLALSVVSVQELYEGQSTKLQEKEAYLMATIAPLRVLPYTYDIAREAGMLARDLGRPIALADAAIAACALAHDAYLFTLNQKDFLGIFGLQLFDLRYGRG